MSLPPVLGRFLNLDDARSVEGIDASFAAPWAHQGPAWVFFGCLALAALAALFYLRAQPRARPAARWAMAAARAVLLCLLLVILAEPILTIRLISEPRPQLWLLFDGTDSMAIEDGLSDAERKRLAEALGPAFSGGSAAAAASVPAPAPPAASGAPGAPARSGESKASRMAIVRALFAGKERRFLDRLAEKFRLRAFIFDRADGARALELSSARAGRVDGEHLARQLTTAGQVTALGAALGDLARKESVGNLAGLLLVSDFGQNSGPPPLAEAKRLGVPIYTLGIGPAAALDVGVDLEVPLFFKKGERSQVEVTLRQSGLAGRPVKVKLLASPLDAGSAGAPAANGETVGERSVDLTDASASLEFPFTPTRTGKLLLSAEVEAVEGEAVGENNRSEREVAVRDDFLRLFFVEYEPTWEWRFIKEVFHRDHLVGTRGFRTFLRSADPRVRRSNELFVSSLTPPRGEFFSSDVIFLGDLPATTLSPRFCEMVKEFVGKFGGGLVIVSGPRFGPGQLKSTPLSDMLPVVVNPDLHLRDEKEFRLRLTPEAALVDFMNLGSDSAEGQKAWSNLGPLSWYQPVARLHPLAVALAEHPSDTCGDSKAPQPLIAMRRYGRGEVVYLGFNETWRLRRKYGERYYRQFWGQMIHRLGLSHALGSEKRFVVRADRQEYRPEERVVLTVEAYDENFEPLSPEKLPEGKLTAEITSPGRAPGSAGKTESVSIAQLREGVFEARIPVYEAGEHRVSVKDPVTGSPVPVSFKVTDLSAERRSALRNAALEEEIALGTGGKTYSVLNAEDLFRDIQPPRRPETAVRVFALWNTWLFFTIIVSLMLGEWLARKLMNLP
jgi:hypothetical protein